MSFIVGKADKIDRVEAYLYRGNEIIATMTTQNSCIFFVDCTKTDNTGWNATIQSERLMSGLIGSKVFDFYERAREEFNEEVSYLLIQGRRMR